MRCPKCQYSMDAMTLIGVEIDNCPNCNGCWLDRDELHSITRSRGNKALTLELVDKEKTPFNCPRCHGALFEGTHPNKPGFLIDECEKCGGIWLDRGELTTLLQVK